MEKGLNFEELDAQTTGLLPDRVEMRRRRGGTSAQSASASSGSATIVAPINAQAVQVQTDVIEVNMVATA